MGAQQWTVITHDLQGVRLHELCVFCVCVWASDVEVWLLTVMVLSTFHILHCVHLVGLTNMLNTFPTWNSFFFYCCIATFKAHDMQKMLFVSATWPLNRNQNRLLQMPEYCFFPTNVCIHINANISNTRSPSVVSNATKHATAIWHDCVFSPHQ